MSTGGALRIRRRISVGTAMRGLTLAIVVFVAYVHAVDPLVRESARRLPALEWSLVAASVGAGLALLGLGVLFAVNHDLRWWRLLALPVAALGLFWSVVPAAVAVLATMPHPPAVSAKPARTTGLEYRVVTITTKDGVELSGWYIPSRNGAAVLVLHGAGSATREDVLPHAETLAYRGYGVLLLDTRGHGASGGHAMDLGWYGDRDISAALDTLAKQPDVKGGQIGVLGVSMGGEQAITAAASDDRIRSVVAEGATNRVYEDVRRTLFGIDVFLGVPQYRALYGLTDLLTPADPPMPLEDAVQRIAPRQVLLIDTATESTYGLRQACAAPRSTQLWAPASAHHTGALQENPAEWRRRVVGFFDQTIGSTRTAN